MRIFLENYTRYAELKIAIIPCHGKNAAVKWRSYQKRFPSQQEAKKWQQQFADCNIAAVTGSISGITVVDCDDPNKTLESLFEEFGETPVVASTPRGGLHLYYRYTGEKSLTHYNGKLIDVRGEGGYILLPPSRGAENQKGYVFAVGDFLDLANLPCTTANLPKSADVHKQIPRILIRGENGIREGYRNKFLFDEGRKLAARGILYESLTKKLLQRNEQQCMPPLAPKDVESICASIMRYYAEGRLYVSGQQYFRCPRHLLDKFMEKKPDCFLVYAYLKMRNYDNSASFQVAIDWLANTLNYGRTKIRRILDDLIAMDLLRRTHQGGQFRGDASLYVWGSESTTE